MGHTTQPRKILLPITGTVLVAHALALWGLPQLNPPQPADAPIVMETRMWKRLRRRPRRRHPSPRLNRRPLPPNPPSHDLRQSHPLQRRLLRPQNQKLSQISLQPRIRKRNKLLKQKHPQKHHHLHHLRPLNPQPSHPKPTAQTPHARFRLPPQAVRRCHRARCCPSPCPTRPRWNSMLQVRSKAFSTRPVPSCSGSMTASITRRASPSACF